MDTKEIDELTTTCLRFSALPAIASGERKPSAWGRRGCAICGKGIGAFQYKTVGMCNHCRSNTARDLGVKRNLVKSPDDADRATWYLSALASESEREAAGTADGKPDGQAENASVLAHADEKPSDQ